MREAQQRCTAEEFMEWRAMARIDPWHERRADYQAASIVKAVLTAAGYKGIKLGDCLLEWNAEPPAPMSATEMEKNLDLVLAAAGGTVKK